MPTPTPGASLSSARGAFYAWRRVASLRESTDLSVLDHPLVREAWSTGFSRGVKDRLALETEVSQALTVIGRFSDLLEQLVFEREAMEIVADEEEEDALSVKRQ